MKKITYIGAQPAIEVEYTVHARSHTVRAARGEPVAFPESVACELLKRSADWTEIGTERPTTAYPTTTTNPN